MSDKPLVHIKRVPIHNKELEITTKELIKIFNTYWEDLTEKEINKIKKQVRSNAGKDNTGGFIVFFDRLMIGHSISKNYQKMKIIAELFRVFFNKIFLQIDDELANEMGEWARKYTEYISKYIT